MCGIVLQAQASPLLVTYEDLSRAAKQLQSQQHGGAEGAQQQVRPGLDSCTSRYGNHGSSLLVLLAGSIRQIKHCNLLCKSSGMMIHLQLRSCYKSGSQTPAMAVCLGLLRRWWWLLRCRRYRPACRQWNSTWPANSSLLTRTAMQPGQPCKLSRHACSLSLAAQATSGWRRAVQLTRGCSHVRS